MNINNNYTAITIMNYFYYIIHHAPFDFTDGESELASGFNIEYRNPLLIY